MSGAKSPHCPNAAAHQQFNDGMAAAQQTMNNAVFSQQ
jgi:hypothetical protein